MEIGKCYQITRITGKTVSFKLLVFTNYNERICMAVHQSGGTLWLDCLTEDEIESIKEIECEKD